MKQWYVLKTKFAQEKKAEAHLSNQRVESWLPLYHDRRLSGGRVSARLEPLFPGYIFARFDPEEIHTTTIRATRGVATIVSFGSRLAIMSDADMAVLQRGAPAADSGEPALAHGDALVIESGVFEGLSAIWHEPQGAKRAMMLISLMGRLVELDLRRVRAEGIKFRRVAAAGQEAA
ncbi:transcription/translation regulatory transformer protein RfaH [Pantoea dispersa]|uniref:transcription/translation regulatory transformer protein RfaH n=1 Tax=Pantoea TaxID=53335 RepID=UPI0021AFEE75|nr:transcription/translation regulatory transformer protein RfaH [Pantoea dispersa]MDU4748398.1 transcription/translation regulatory transformer protein RfaH [Pantoea sp.]MCT6593038.1 transcription/translation regulatory transformer protein RfaH [Pantoea dispersa]MCW0323848.1 Transcription antitermination protein RfaH [Pantoea dispersa]MCW0328584.1 Transcription antitermination protein RfaH [Pantoea dispersa]MCW0435009.1 Transcription antitermination protein RfaH [Pantoea dispersa]